MWLQEHEARVRDAHLVREAAKAEAARAKADREARASWVNLIAALRMRMQLSEEHGGEGAGEAVAGSRPHAGGTGACRPHVFQAGARACVLSASDGCLLLRSSCYGGGPHA
jgi:hypothetical protein